MRERRAFALLAVALTGGCFGTILHFHRPPVPDFGVLVGASVRCERGCVLYRDQVIRTIDGAQVEDAATVYHVLADGRPHAIVVSNARGEDSEIVASWTAHDLMRTPLVAAAAVHHDIIRYSALGHADRHRAFFGVDRGWVVPDDLFGEPYIVVDVPEATAGAMIMALGFLRDAPVPIFAVRPSHRLEFDASAWTEQERADLAEMPWVRMVTAPVSEKDLYGRWLGYDENGYVAPPQVHLVDCHGVVRRHIVDNLLVDYPQSYLSWAPETFQRADALVEDARQGRCWLPFGVEG